MASVGAISSEVESGVIYSIITRPIKRSSYVLGKYIVLGVLSVSYGIFLFAAIITIYTIFKLPIVNTLEPLNVIKELFFFSMEPLAILSFLFLGLQHLNTN